MKEILRVGVGPGHLVARLVWNEQGLKVLIYMGLWGIANSLVGWSRI